MVFCELCGESFLEITQNHLTHHHDGLRMLEYHLMFPKAETVDEEVRVTRGKSISEANTGSERGPHTEEWNRHISEGLRDKPKSDEHIHNMSISAQERWANMSPEEYLDWGRKMSERTITEDWTENLSKARKEMWKDPDYRNKQIAAGIASRKITPNKTELLLWEYIQEYLPPGWILNVVVGTVIAGMVPDFINEERKQVIEAFGTYWHSFLRNPNKKSEEETVQSYKEAGYDCVVVWGDEIKDGIILTLDRFED